jgi:hypothetical protein
MAKPKRPRDPMQLAKLIGDLATDEVPSYSPKAPPSAAAGSGSQNERRESRSQI